MSEKISIGSISDGMVLAESVINNFGHVILKSGIELKSKQKILLQTWNIKEVIIKSSDDEDAIPMPDNYYELAKFKIKDRMNWEIENDFEKELIEVGILNMVERLQDESKKG